MKLGINIDKSGTFLFKAPNNDKVITKSHVQKNMLGWLFHTPSIADYISLLPVEKYVVTPTECEQNDPLIEISKEKALEFYSSLASTDEKPVQKVNK